MRSSADEGPFDVPAGGWHPRGYQQNLWNYLERGGKRAVAIWHRRAGKDEVCLHWGAVAAHMRVGVYWHMLPEASQARKAVWDAVNPHTGLRRINEAFPRGIRESTRETDMAIRFKSGSLWQLVGSDNYNSLVGSPPAGVVFSEFALADPSAWGYLRPILAENGGWALFITTPRGRNHASTFYEAARQDRAWFAETLPATMTNVFTREQLEVEHRELIREYGPDDGEARYRQEYLVSFDAGVMGSYYGSLMEAAEKERRITSVPHEPTLPVHTAWDLGIGDATAIWCVQLAGREVRFIDYIENSGVGLDWYTRELDRRPWKWGEHVLPHDAEARELGTGRSRIEVLRQLGFHRTTVVQKERVEDGVNAVRMILPRCWFDVDKCARGISALQNYRRSWNEALRTYSDRPLHDWTSHACLTADARVLTEGGLCAIRDIRAGDRVWTPCGYARVTHAGPVKRARQLIEIRLVDDRLIRCTPEHKVLTDRGFVEAGDLKGSERILRGDEWTIRLIALCSRARRTGFRATITGATSGAATAHPISTARSGKAIMARCRKAMTFITRMATRLTTPSITSNVWMPASISGNTHWNGMQRESLSLLASLPAYEPLSGTAARTGGESMPAQPNKAGREWSGMTAFASNAADLFVRRFLAAPSGATRIARLRTYDSAGDGPLVYDLTCERHACYQANGFLVSNSDALRYFALSNVRNAGSARALKYPDLAVV